MKRFLITLLSLALLPLLAACTQEDGDREPGRPAVAVALDTGSALSREAGSPRGELYGARPGGLRRSPGPPGPIETRKWKKQHTGEETGISAGGA